MPLPDFASLKPIAGAVPDPATMKAAMPDFGSLQETTHQTPIAPNAYDAAQVQDSSLRQGLQPGTSFLRAVGSNPMGFLESLPNDISTVMEKAGASALNEPTRLARLLTGTPKIAQFGADDGQMAVDQPLPFKAGVPIYQPQGTVLQPGGNAIEKLISGFTTPGMIASFPFAESKLVQGAFLSQTAPAAIEAAGKMLSPNSTPDERKQAGTDFLINGIMSLGLGHALGHEGVPAAVPETGEAPPPAGAQPSAPSPLPDPATMTEVAPSAAPTAPAPNIAPLDATGVVRTPDGQIDPVRTAIAKLTQQPSLEAKETAPVPAVPNGPDVGEQTPPAPTAAAAPTIAEKAAATPAAPVTLADLAQLQNEMRGNQIKPSEPKPVEPAIIENSQPGAGATVSPAPAASVGGNELHTVAASPDPNWRVTVQADQSLGNKTVPGYVQIDDVSGGQNQWSKSPQTLAKEGVQVPDFSKLPQGTYTYAEAVKKLSQPEVEATKNVPGAVPSSEAAPAQSRSGFMPPPMPEKFNSLQDALKYREAYKNAEIEFYKSLGLTESESNRFFRAGDNRSNVDVSNIEDKLTPKNRERLDAFSTGEGHPVYQWDRQYNPGNLAGVTDKADLARAAVGNLSLESTPEELGDKMIHAAAALRQLKENGGTWSDIAKALDSYTTRISGSQGDKAFVFKKYGEAIRKFAEQQGIDLPQGVFGSKIGSSDESVPQIHDARKSFFIRPRSDGIHDIIDEVQDHGGITSPKPGESGGEYDGHKEAMTGTASLLRRRYGGLTPDKMVENVQQAFPRIKTPGDLYDAINAANKQRDALRTNGGGHEAQTQRFWNAISKPENARGVEKITADQLNVGQKFRLKGKGFSNEELTVTHVDPDTGDVTVQDGTTFGRQDLPEGTEVYIKKGSLVTREEKPAKQQQAGSGMAGKLKTVESSQPRVENLAPQKPVVNTTPKLRPGEKGTGSLLQADEPFNLAGERGTDAERIAAEKAKAEATKKADAEFQAKNTKDLFQETGEKGFPISRGEFEDILKRAWNANLRDYYDDPTSKTDPKTWQDWVEQSDPHEIGLVLDSDYELYNRFQKYFGKDSDVTVADVADAYKKGTLAQSVSRESKATSPIKTSEIPFENRGGIGEPKKRTPLDAEKLKPIWDTATQRSSKNNEASVLEARKELLIQSHVQDLSKTLGIPQSKITQSFRSWSNYPASAREMSQRLNSGVPEVSQWTGIENSAFVSRRSVSPMDVDKMVKEVDAPDKSWNTPNAQSLRNYIVRALLAIDTRINYKDLALKVLSTLKPRGLYESSKKLITIRENSPHTVAHEIGHYLDHKWALESGIDSLLSDSSINLDIVAQKLSPERAQWIKRFKEFVENISDRSDIGSEYLQSRREVFARFMDKFVRWTEEQAGARSWGEDSYRQDRFTQSDMTAFVKLLQEKAFVDANDGNKLASTKAEADIKTEESESEKPDRERSLAEVKSDIADAKDRLKQTTMAVPKEFGGSKEYKQATAVANARYQSLQRELLHHPDYVAEQLAAQHEAVTGANEILKPLGKAIRPDDPLNLPSLAEKLPPEQLQQLQKFASQLDATHGTLLKMPAKMVSRVYAEMQDDGRLPKSNQTTPDTGRTLDQMTRRLQTGEFDSPKVPLLERLAIGQKLADTWQGAKDAFHKAIAKTTAAWKAGIESMSHPPTDDDYRAAKKHWIAYDARTDVENMKYAKALVDKVPDPTRRKAMSVWLDADGDKSLLEFQRQSVPDEFHKIWDTALKLTPDEIRAAVDVKNNFEMKAEDAINAGLMEKTRENYGVPQVWEKPPQVDQDPAAEAKKGSPGNPYAKLDSRDPFFSFQRQSPTYFDGIMAGGKPRNLDIAHLVTVYDSAFHKALGSRGWIGGLQDATARDGTPVVRVSGTASTARSEEGSTTFVNAKAAGKDAVTADGRPYRSHDHPALKDWKFVSKDAAGNPILVKGDMLIHPDYYEDVKNELETPRWTRKLQPGEKRGTLESLGYGALRASGYLKASKFIGPFHIVTEALHAATHGAVGLLEGITHGGSPSTRGFELDLADPNQALLARNMSLGYGKAREMFEEGLGSHGGIWGHVPGLGTEIARLNNFTFNNYIPKLKMKVGLAVLERNLKRYSKDTWEGKALSREQIGELTGRQMDAAFGGQNYRLLGSNKNTLAFMRLAMVAPDFLISRAKVVAQAFKPYNHEQRTFLLAQAAGVYVLSRILNTTFSDNHDPHFELRNWDAVVIGKRAYHARFLVSDAANLARDLLGLGSFDQHGIPFITGRLGVIPKMATEIGTGKDLFTGQNKEGLFEAHNPLLKAFSIMAGDTADWMTPMGVDGFLPGAAAKGITGRGAALTAMIGVSSRKENATGQIWNLARQFNLNSKDPATVNYQKTRDAETGPPSAYRALNNLLDAGDMKRAQQEYNALKAGGKTPAAIAAHFARNFSFTGNQTREQQFLRSLTPEQKQTYQAARAEQQARQRAFRALAK